MRLESSLFTRGVNPELKVREHHDRLAVLEIGPDLLIFFTGFEQLLEFAADLNDAIAERKRPS